MAKVRLGKKFHFDAAHSLPDYDGPCANLHGHRWEYEIILEGEVDPETGMLLDFNELKKIATEEIHDKLDHKHLNSLEDDVFQNPTAERMVSWIGNQLMPRLPNLVAVKLWESPGSWVQWDRYHPVTKLC